MYLNCTNVQHLIFFFKSKLHQCSKYRFNFSNLNCTNVQNLNWNGKVGAAKNMLMMICPFCFLPQWGFKFTRCLLIINSLLSPVEGWQLSFAQYDDDIHLDVVVNHFDRHPSHPIPNPINTSTVLHPSMMALLLSAQDL